MSMVRLELLYRLGKESCLTGGLPDFIGEEGDDDAWEEEERRSLKS